MFKFKAILLISILLLQACSGNSFQLRKELNLPKMYQRIQVDNISYEHDFVQAFELALEESDGKLVEKAATVIKINNYREGKRIVAYTKERKAREFLLYLKFGYTISMSGQVSGKETKNQRINLDRIFVYDADFALGKAEEEKKIRQELYKEAARLILLKLHYSKK
ncbi:MAG: hypothetical protein L3J51_10405 [Cocleimonas sp.]|nr:hypothetical protein [Cocleimonas sp.]